jgi:outer membrane biosynthesis protein TonB
MQVIQLVRNASQQHALQQGYQGDPSRPLPRTSGKYYGYLAWAGDYVDLALPPEPAVETQQQPQPQPQQQPQLQPQLQPQPQPQPQPQARPQLQPQPQAAPANNVTVQPGATVQTEQQPDSAAAGDEDQAEASRPAAAQAGSSDENATKQAPAPSPLKIDHLTSLLKRLLNAGGMAVPCVWVHLVPVMFCCVVRVLF